MTDPPFITSVLCDDCSRSAMLRSVQVEVLLGSTGQFIIRSDEDVRFSNGLLVHPDSGRPVPIKWTPVALDTRTINFHGTS